MTNLPSLEVRFLAQLSARLQQQKKSLTELIVPARPARLAVLQPLIHDKSTARRTDEGGPASPHSRFVLCCNLRSFCYSPSPPSLHAREPFEIQSATMDPASSVYYDDDETATTPFNKNRLDSRDLPLQRATCYWSSVRAALWWEGELSQGPTIGMRKLDGLRLRRSD